MQGAVISSSQTTAEEKAQALSKDLDSLTSLSCSSLGDWDNTMQSSRHDQASLTLGDALQKYGVSQERDSKALVCIATSLSVADKTLATHIFRFGV